MERRRLQIPSGMQDTLPGECAGKRRLEDKLRRLFTLGGYQEIETPILEYVRLSPGASVEDVRPAGAYSRRPPGFDDSGGSAGVGAAEKRAAAAAFMLCAVRGEVPLRNAVAAL